jgi:hypothetical protein
MILHQPTGGLTLANERRSASILKHIGMLEEEELEVFV